VSTAPPGGPTRYRRAILERRPDGLQLTLLPPGFARWRWDQLYVGLILGAIWCGIACVLLLERTGPDLNHPPPLRGIGGWLSVGLLGLVAPFLYATVRALSSGSISVTGDLLTVRRRGLLWSRRWRWKRHELLAILPGGGLWIIDMGDRYYVFSERDRDELTWVADLLSEAFDLDDGPPDSLPVLLLRRWDERPARLHAWTGRLALFSTDAPWPYFRFLTVPTPRFLQWHKILAPGKPFYLAPGDASCRIETDGAAKLQLTPSGTSFHLTLYCEDGDGLQQALARFWGAADAVS
jgi:hypothetical protein